MWLHRDKIYEIYEQWLLVYYKWPINIWSTWRNQKPSVKLQVQSAVLFSFIAQFSSYQFNFMGSFSPEFPLWYWDNLSLSFFWFRSLFLHLPFITGSSIFRNDNIEGSIDCYSKSFDVVYVVRWIISCLNFICRTLLAILIVYYWH